MPAPIAIPEAYGTTPSTRIQVGVPPVFPGAATMSLIGPNPTTIIGGGGGQTVLGAAAAQAIANPGTFVLLPDSGLGQGMYYPGDTGPVINWQNKIAWDSRNNKIKILGSTHDDGGGAPEHYIEYNEATNTWTLNMVWVQYPSFAHWGDHAGCCMPDTGELIALGMAGDTRVLRITDGQTIPPMSVLSWAAPAGRQIMGAWEYDPVQDKFLLGDSNTDISFFARSNGAKTFMDYAWGWQLWGQWSRYCPGKGIYFGGGRGTTEAFFVYLAMEGGSTFTRYDNAPWEQDIWSQITVDPATGRLVAFRWNGSYPSGFAQAYDFDIARGAGNMWQPRASVAANLAGSIYSKVSYFSPSDRASGAHASRASCYIPKYGVTFWICAVGYYSAPDNRMYVYKHPSGSS